MKKPLIIWILLFVFGAFFFLILYGLAQVVTMRPDVPWWRTVIAVIGTSAVILGIYELCIRIFEKRKATDLSLSVAAPDTGRGLLVGALYFLLVVGTMAAGRYYVIDSVQFDWQLQLEAFALFFIVAVGEEVLFRGIIFRLIDQQFNTIAALIVSALIFGVVHILNTNATWWSSLAIAIEAGVMLSVAYKYSGTLWLPIGIHWAWNYMQGNVLGFAVSGLDAGESIFTPVITGPDFITGGEFGAEASVIAVFFGIVISLILALRRNRQGCSII